MTTTTQPVEQTHSLVIRSAGLVFTGLLAMVISTAVNLGIYYAAGVAMPEVADWPGAGVGQIIGATTGYLFFAVLAYAVVRRLSSRPRRHYRIVASIALVLTLAMPVLAYLGMDPSGAPAASLPTVATLGLMHVVSYVVSVSLLTRR